MMSDCEDMGHEKYMTEEGCLAKIRNKGEL